MSRHCVQTILARQRVAGLQWASTASSTSVGSEADIATLSSSLSLEITDSRSTEDRPEGGNRGERRGSMK